ncbi:MAG: hypothetical protein LBF19_07410 [Prevotellaceae bacterium]|jgi:hypothetical protein|nr:hypothetical protein [Prevotellaceae bacterium]
MRTSFFNKILLCLTVMCFCSVGASAEPVIAAVSGLSDWSAIIDYAAPVTMAMAAVAIPVQNMDHLYCVTQTVFTDLQSKFGKLYVVDVEIDTDERYQFLVRRPTRQHLEVIASYGTDNTKINDFVLKNLVIASNEIGALDDGLVFSAFNAEISKIINQAQGFLSRA